MSVRKRTNALSPRGYAICFAGIVWREALRFISQRGRFLSALVRPLVWLFNVEGTLDLLAAIALATLHDASPYMGPAYWIPAVWVPALLVTHYVTFVVLMRRAFRGR